MKKWYKAPDAKCPYCENIYQIKMDLKRSLIILPLAVCLSIIVSEFITRYILEYNTATTLVAGAVVGLILGIGLRLCHVVKYDYK
jgi:hypothetical protein